MAGNPILWHGREKLIIHARPPKFGVHFLARNSRTETLLRREKPAATLVKPEAASPVERTDVSQSIVVKPFQGVQTVVGSGRQPNHH